MRGPTDLEDAFSPAGGRTSRHMSTRRDRSETPDFYTWYLNKTIRYFEPNEVAGAWLQGLVKQRHVIQGSQRPIDDLMRIFSDHSASMDQAITNLEVLIGALHSGEDKDAIRMHFESHEVGRRALSWFLESRAYIRFEPLLYPKFIQLVAHALIAQDSGDCLWDLMLVDDSFELFATDRQIWSGRALKALVESTAFWASNRESVNQAYYCFKRAVLVNPLRERIRPHFRIPQTMASFSLYRLFERTPSSYVKLEVFDGMLASVRSRYSSGPMLAYLEGRMHLHHPVKPTADRALNFLRAIDGMAQRPEEVERIFGSRREETSSLLFWYIILVAQVLEQQGRGADARWVLDFGYDEIPAYFTRGWQNPYKGNARGLHKRRVRNTEIARGVPVGKHGYLEQGHHVDQHIKLSRALDYDWKPSITPPWRR